MLNFKIISFILFVCLFNTLSSTAGQQKSDTSCLGKDTQMGKLASSLEEGRDEMRNNYKLYGDSALNLLEDLPENLVDQIKKSFEIEILMEKVNTNKNIKYENCSHLQAVIIELKNVLKQGEDKWDEYWQNQETDFSKKEIKQIEQYIQNYIDAENKIE